MCDTEHLAVPAAKLHKHDSNSTLNLPLHDSVEVQDESDTVQVETGRHQKLTVDTDTQREEAASPSGTYNARQPSPSDSPTADEKNVEDVGQFQGSYYPMHMHAIRNSKKPPTGRTIILCLDGTGDQFDGDNSNVVRFFRCLKKDEPSKQLVYYQAGLGTYVRITACTLARD